MTAHHPDGQQFLPHIFLETFWQLQNDPDEHAYKNQTYIFRFKPIPAYLLDQIIISSFSRKE
jgi:hypothetical protein